MLSKESVAPYIYEQANGKFKTFKKIVNSSFGEGFFKKKHLKKIFKNKQLLFNNRVQFPLIRANGDKKQIKAVLTDRKFDITQQGPNNRVINSTHSDLMHYNNIWDKKVKQNKKLLSPTEFFNKKIS